MNKTQLVANWKQLRTIQLYELLTINRKVHKYIPNAFDGGIC